MNQDIPKSHNITTAQIYSSVIESERKGEYLGACVQIIPHVTDAKKVKLAEELFSMPPSSKLLLKILEYEGSMSQKELVKKTLLPDRTVRLAMSHLLEKGYVKKKVSLRDSRQKIYLINSDLQP